MKCLLNRSPDDRTGHENEHFRPCYQWQCARCGWNPEEAARRKKQKLVTGSEILPFAATWMDQRIPY